MPSKREREQADSIEDMIVFVCSLPTMAFTAFSLWAAWFFSALGSDVVATVFAAGAVLLLIALSRGLAETRRQLFCLVGLALMTTTIAGAYVLGVDFSGAANGGTSVVLIISLIAFWFGPFAAAYFVLDQQARKL